MNNQEEILKIYNSILENKNLFEVMVKPSESSSSYSNLTFADRTKGDDINKALLDDIQTAADKAGVKVTIDFAKTGHGKNAKSGNVSRHWRNAAVDIDFINGKAISPANKEVVNKFVDVLISMGYNKNAEGTSHPKAVLTFGFPGHDDHVHVSNLSDQSSEAPEGETDSETQQSNSDNETNSSSGDTSSSDYFSDNQRDPMLTKIAKAIGGVLGLKEEFNTTLMSESYYIPGKNNSKKFGKTIIPKSENERIKSAVSGVVNNGRYNSNCQNQVTIEHEIDNETFYLEYCGMGALNVSNGDTINRGTVLGTTANGSDVEVTLYDSSYNQIPIDDENSEENFSVIPISKPRKQNDSEPEVKINPSKKERKNPKEPHDEYRKEPTRYRDPLMAAVLKLPFKPFENKYDKSGKMVQKRWGYAADKKPIDPWILQSIKDPFGSKRRKQHNEEIEEDVKLKENVEKIKRLLK
jgi:hypothetical protein